MTCFGPRGDFIQGLREEFLLVLLLDDRYCPAIDWFGIQFTCCCMHVWLHRRAFASKLARRTLLEVVFRVMMLQLYSAVGVLCKES